MIKKTRAEIKKCILHKVANKFNSGHNVFSEDLIRFDQESYDLMKGFLLKPFGSLTQSYRFFHHADVRLNELNNYASEVFSDESTFIEYSKNIVNHLYEQSNSAQIKTGDVIIVFIEGLEYKDVLTEAVGVFKIENKVDFFQTYLDDNESWDVVVQKGISTIQPNLKFHPSSSRPQAMRERPMFDSKHSHHTTQTPNNDAKRTETPPFPRAQVVSVAESPASTRDTGSPVCTAARALAPSGEQTRNKPAAVTTAHRERPTAIIVVIACKTAPVIPFKRQRRTRTPRAEKRRPARGVGHEREKRAGTEVRLRGRI